MNGIAYPAPVTKTDDITPLRSEGAVTKVQISSHAQSTAIDADIMNREKRIYNEVNCRGDVMRLLRSIFVAAWVLLSPTVVLPQPPQLAIAITVVDEVGVPVNGAQIVVRGTGAPAVTVQTDFVGRSTFVLPADPPYRLEVTKPGFYQAVVNPVDAEARELRVVLHHEQMFSEQVSVTASVPGINPEQLSDKTTMNLPEITNLPYPSSRDIRNILPFYPGVVQDESGQVHVAGSETWATLDLLDGFDIRSPVSGNLALRVSADAVRSIDQESTRYPVEYGRTTGGVIAIYTGMADNKFRFNATNFVPSFQQKNGIRFDKFVPRLTFAGPIMRSRAWFFDGLEFEYDNIFISELPRNANTNHLIRGSNLLKLQANVTPANIFSAGLLTNAYHSPYDGLSPLVPQQSTVKRNTTVWMPYVRDQQSFGGGALVDAGVAVLRIRDGFEPYADGPFKITPELYLGSYFQAQTGHSQRVEGNAALYLPPRHWHGQHDVKLGIDLDHVSFDQGESLAPINYLREDGTLLRRSTFPTASLFARHNFEVGAYGQDRWTLPNGLLLELGLRVDWDEIVRRALLSPRVAATYSPSRFNGKTKLSAGMGLYYDHTQLEYITRANIGPRIDQYYAVDGATPQGSPQITTFVADYGLLREPRALNWSVGIEQKVPGAVFVRAEVIKKRISRQFAYENETNPAGLSGTYQLRSSREDHDDLFEVDARRTFSRGYTLFGAYTHSKAHTDSAIDYLPAIFDYGLQQSAPLPWDMPNRVLSWGWLPFAVPYFIKSWDFVYTADWHTGFPYTSINADEQVIGPAAGRRFPNYKSFSPGLEWRFHFHGSYFGLRGVLENMTASRNPAVVNRVVDSPQYGTFSEFDGRSFTARIRLINSSK
jgi:hypothetical protein